MNASNRKYMLVGGTKRGEVRLGSSETIDGLTFEVFDKFIYFRYLLTADNALVESYFFVELDLLWAPAAVEKHLLLHQMYYVQNAQNAGNQVCSEGTTRS